MNATRRRGGAVRGCIIHATKCINSSGNTRGSGEACVEECCAAFKSSTSSTEGSQPAERRARVLNPQGAIHRGPAAEQILRSCAGLLHGSVVSQLSFLVHCAPPVALYKAVKTLVTSSLRSALATARRAHKIARHRRGRVALMAPARLGLGRARTWNGNGSGKCELGRTCSIGPQSAPCPVGSADCGHHRRGLRGCPRQPLHASHGRRSSVWRR